MKITPKQLKTILIPPIILIQLQSKYPHSEMLKPIKFWAKNRSQIGTYQRITEIKQYQITNIDNPKTAKERTINKIFWNTQFSKINGDHKNVNIYRKAVTDGKSEVVAMTARETRAKANWTERKARLVGVPGMPWISFMRTLLGANTISSSGVVSGGAEISTGCTDGWLLLILKRTLLSLSFPFLFCSWRFLLSGTSNWNELEFHHQFWGIKVK